MARSPYWAITVLSEFARRTAYSGVKPEFHDTLLRLATPLLLNVVTAKMAEPLIGAIAQAQRLGGDTRTWNEARWKRILNLVPPSTPINSPAVLGLANTAIDIQYRWEKYGKKFEYGFPAVAMMQERFKGFPSYAAIRTAAIPVVSPEEKEINDRRLLRYMANPRYAMDRARSDRLHREIVGTMRARSSAPWLETAGGG
jgi:hypothetical protein